MVGVDIRSSFAKFKNYKVAKRKERFLQGMTFSSRPNLE